MSELSKDYDDPFPEVIMQIHSVEKGKNLFTKITQSEIPKQLDLSRSKVQRTMKKLVNEGVIENIGSHRSGEWKVKK